MSDQTKAAERAARELADLAEVVDDRPLTRRERLRRDEIAAWVRGVVGAELKSYDEIDAWASEAIRAELKGVEFLAALQAYLVAIGEQEKVYRRRTETDRAYDSEIAAAAGLGREHDEREPMERLEDVNNRDALYDAVEPPGSPARIAAELEPLSDILERLQAAHVPGFDWSKPHTCGPLCALLAEHLGKIDAEHKGLPDVFSSREHIVYTHYNTLRVQYGMKPVRSIRQFAYDLAYAQKTVAAARDNKRLPRRGIQQKR